MRTAIGFLIVGGLLLAYGGWLSFRIGYHGSDSDVDKLLYLLGGTAFGVGLFGLSWELAIRGQSWLAWLLGGLIALAGIVACERSVRR